MRKKLINFDATEKTTPKRKAKAAQAPTGSVGLDKSGYVQGYFMPLGWDTEDKALNYYFFVSSVKSIIKLSASKMSRQNLLQLAPLEFWSDNFIGSQSFNILAAVDFLVMICNAAGYFSPDKIRGRGAWMDKGKPVFHAGTQLFIDGERHHLGKSDTEYIYEMRSPVRIPIENPMQAEEASRITKMLMKLNFGTIADARLVAGFLAIAPLCGVLRWRPHLWITGTRGSGKTWLIDDVICVMTRGISATFQGNTSEMGVIQKLNNDAFVVVYDEAEGNDEKGAKQRQEVISAARAASSANGAPLVKGSREGHAVERYVRSCFVFSSINPQIIHDSDKRRFCILEFAKLKDNTMFERIESARAEMLATDYPERFQARSIRMIPQILKSIETFVTAITAVCGNKATGDQIGTLLGGWWHTLHDEPVTLEKAKEEAEAILQILGILSGGLEATDEQRCLQAILSYEQLVEGENMRRVHTIGELVEIASTLPTGQGGIRRDEANDRLGRLGLKVVQVEGVEYLAILNNSIFVKTVLQKTAPEWAVSFVNVLSRLKGAKKLNNMRFSPGVSGRSIGIPIEEIFA